MTDEPGAQMRAEMNEQPSVLARLAQRRGDLVAGVRSALPEDVRGIALVARGSSDHAAVYGRYVLEVASGRPVSMSAPSLHTLYGAATDYRGCVAIAVSQSGRTPEIITMLQELQRAGATGIAVTNTSPSPLEDIADVTIPLDAGDEVAVPATKTFTAQLAAFAMIAETFGPVPWSDDDWAQAPDVVARTLADEASPEVAAEAIGEAAGLIAVARGFLFPAALEAALKLKETTSILAHGYSAADLRHGPIAVVERDFPVLAFDAPGPAADDMAALRRELIDRDARVLRCGVGVGDLPVPEGLSEAFAPVPATVRAQQVSHALARARGLDPDRPEGLRKVTPTH